MSMLNEEAPRVPHKTPPFNSTSASVIVKQTAPVWLNVPCWAAWALRGGCRWARLVGAGDASRPAADGEVHKMVMNIGKRPTFGDQGEVPAGHSWLA
jgi:hypothetical protein